MEEAQQYSPSLLNHWYSVENRIMSFRQCNRLSDLKCINLAQCGFYFNKNNQNIECFICLKSVPIDSILIFKDEDLNSNEIHRSLDLNCPAHHVRDWYTLTVAQAIPLAEYQAFARLEEYAAELKSKYQYIVNCIQDTNDEKYVVNVSHQNTTIHKDEISSVNSEAKTERSAKDYVKIEYPEDKILIWECASELGRHHEQLAVLLHGELLGARTYMTITEPDVEDPFYMTLLLFIVNGLFSSDATYQSPYKIPFLAKHIQAIRVLDRNLLPSPIRSSLADEHQTDRQNYYRQILEETLDLCKIADESQSYEKLMNCAQTLKSFEDTSLHDVARFYKQQAELRAYAYQKAYHFKYFKDIAYKLLASFENIDGIPNLILLIKSILQANKKLPPFIFLPCEQSNICERQILHVELSAKEFKFAAGLVCPIVLRVKLKCKTRVDLYAQVALPNGRIRIYYLHSQSGPVSDGMYHLFTSQILISAKRSWTAAATVRIQLGCLLDKTLAAHFDGNNDCSKLSRFVPMYNWIACNIHPINIMF